MRVRRLHVQFYIAILATLAVFVLVNALFWNLFADSRSDAWGISAGAQLAEAWLPPPTATADEYQRALNDLRGRVKMDFALYDSSRRLLANTGYIPNLRPRQLMRSGWSAAHGRPVWVLELKDGRRLVVRPIHPAGGHVFAHAALMVPLSIVLAFMFGAYPIARRLTRRLGRLQSGVEHFGAGNLGTRVAVEGEDEVAALARSFNTSAERIAELVQAHKLLLANCSHELRTPLARIRLLLERISQGGDPTVREELTRNIEELNALIGEMLLASRLDTLKTLEHVEDVDLLALAAEEASHFDRPVEGQAVLIRGDPALLRRLVRNLLDNAQRHAGGATRIEVLEPDSGNARLIVEDTGEGVTENEREKIFEPFYRSGTAQTAVKGFGLGLAIVRQIARAHGGDAVYSAPAAGGSRFTVTLAKGSPAPK